MRPFDTPLRTALALFFLLAVAAAQAPPGYYDTVDTSNPQALRLTLHEVIDDHQRFPYTSSSTDTWDILELAQQDPGDPSRIIDVYRNRSYTKIGGGVGPYNREHSWPKSYGFPDDNSSNYPYTDCHQLFLCDSGYNSARSNKPFRNCNSGCSEYTTDANNGEGGGSGAYPGNSNWSSGQFTQGTWETWIGRRGDIARAMFYLDVRYEGGTHGTTGAGEPDLILTDDEGLIDASNTGHNEPVAYMGMLSVLLQWHLEDPVDDFERQKNDTVFAFQGNRNPFVDHPEWVDCLFLGNCSGGGAAIAPFCFGDGSGSACPCGNTGSTGSGCANGAFSTGAQLSWLGSESIAAADLVLDVAGTTPSQPGLFFQGENAIGGGAGTAFGDGLRCAGGTVVRLEVAISDSLGVATSTVNIAATGGNAAGLTRRYQWWYRDPSGSPCGATFNLSNGLEVTWAP